MVIKKAIVVGIDSYNSMPALDGCVNDVLAVQSQLESTGDFRVAKLLNEEATRSAIQEKIKWVLTEADVSLIYFAGHGIKSDFSTNLVSWDGDQETGVEVDSIQRIIAKLASSDQTVIVILDCCHSGALPINTLTDARLLHGSDLPSVRGRGRVLIAACTDEQKASEMMDENGLARGRFSYHLVKALEGYAANDSGVVTLMAAYDYVAQQFIGVANQAPVIRGDLEGSIELAVGVSRLGGWKQSNEDALEPAEALRKAKTFIDRVRDAIQDGSTNEEWLGGGYRQACAAYEPIKKWFDRLFASQPTLRQSTDLKKIYDNLVRYGQQLSVVNVETLLPQGKVLGSLGQGTFGTVFLVESKEKTRVCFKVFHASDLLQSEKFSRFRRGYEAMQQLDHPHIVKVKEFSNVPYGFFMEFIQGANARAFLPGVINDPNEVVRLLLQVGETLSHAHSRNVIHRDVKPENILIEIGTDGQTSAYLTDFDLAWFDTATKLTKLADGFGSHFYAAPEQMARPNSPAARSIAVDVYSFGQLAFYFITGRDPVPMDISGNAKALEYALAQHWSDPAQANSLLDFYRASSDTDPKRRPKDFQEICQILASVQLALLAPEKDYDLGSFLRRLRFTISGEFGEIGVPTTVTMRSRSGVTEISVYLKAETTDKVTLDVSLRPETLLVDGLKSHEARSVVNHRIDSAINSFSERFASRKAGGAGGSFESNIRIENIQKDAQGVLKARDLISKVIDAIERAGS